jgi:hypothetical protein
VAKEKIDEQSGDNFHIDKVKYRELLERKKLNERTVVNNAESKSKSHGQKASGRTQKIFRRKSGLA